jgi:hypothetical protein
MATFPAVSHVSVSIDRSPADVYAFAADPENLPRWANGLSGSIEQIGGEWIAESPMGRVKVRFTGRNELGVLDHDVVLESGVCVCNPMRVVANGDGSEVLFTLFRRPGLGNEEFAEDASAVARDLGTLKRLLEAH